MNLKQKIYKKHILLYNRDKDVFNNDYLALKTPETMFSVEDMLELYGKCFDCYNEIGSCYSLSRLQGMRRLNLNILAATRENIQAMEFVDVPVIQRLWVAQLSQSIERACLRLNRKLKDKIVWCIKTLGERRERQRARKCIV